MTFAAINRSNPLMQGNRRVFQKFIIPICGLVVPGLLVFPAAAHATPSGPEWAGSANTTHQRDIFPDDGQMRMAEDFEENQNTYGGSNLEISVGALGEGWQDPEGNPSFNVTRSDSGGAWDLGLDGDMTWAVSFAPPLGAGETYDVDYFVNVVFEHGLFDQPELSITGYPNIPEGAVTTGFDPAEDSPFRSWSLITWDGTLTGVNSNELSFVLDAGGDDGSLIDTYDVYTQYALIPEPGAYAAILGGGVLLFLLVRRSRRGRNAV